MIDLNVVTMTREDNAGSRQFATAILSDDGDEIAFMDAHGDVVLTVRRELTEGGMTPVLAVLATGGRFGRQGGFEVLL